MNDKRIQKSKSSFWTTIPGILTGFAATITAIGGLVTVLNQVGIFGRSAEDRPIDPSSPTSVSIAGKWNGTVQTATGRTVEIDLSVDSECRIGKVCGTLKSSAGCSGKLFLNAYW